MKQLGFLDFDTRLQRIDKAGGLGNIPSSSEAGQGQEKENPMQELKDLMSFCYSRSLSSNHCTTCPMKGWSSRFLIDTLFPDFSASMAKQNGVGPS